MENWLYRSTVHGPGRIRGLDNESWSGKWTKWAWWTVFCGFCVLILFELGWRGFDDGFDVEEVYLEKVKMKIPAVTVCNAAFFDEMGFSRGFVRWGGCSRCNITAPSQWKHDLRGDCLTVYDGTTDFGVGEVSRFHFDVDAPVAVMVHKNESRYGLDKEWMVVGGGEILSVDVEEEFHGKPCVEEGMDSDLELCIAEKVSACALPKNISCVLSSHRHCESSVPCSLHRVRLNKKVRVPHGGSSSRVEIRLARATSKSVKVQYIPRNAWLKVAFDVVAFAGVCIGASFMSALELVELFYIFFSTPPKQPAPIKLVTRPPRSPSPPETRSSSKSRRRPTSKKSSNPQKKYQ